MISILIFATADSTFINPFVLILSQAQVPITEKVDKTETIELIYTYKILETNK